MQNLYFVSHGGFVDPYEERLGKVMFELDANLILSLLNNSEGPNKYSILEKRFVKFTKKKIIKYWLKGGGYIPVNPVLGILELTKQVEEVNFTKYSQYFNDFFRKIYKLNNYDELWVYNTFDRSLQFLCVLESIQRTLEVVYQLIPDPRKQTDSTILNKVEGLLTWICDNRNTLEVMGGPILQIAVYAIAGSPEARRFIKYDKLKKVSPEKLALNVAWDFMYWIQREINYYHAGYSDNIFCSYDFALADLLSRRVNSAPRIGKRFIEEEFIDADGYIEQYQLARLENTSLESKLGEMLLEFNVYLLHAEKNSIKFGANKIREIVMASDGSYNK